MWCTQERWNPTQMQIVPPQNTQTQNIQARNAQAQNTQSPKYSILKQYQINKSVSRLKVAKILECWINNWYLVESIEKLKNELQFVSQGRKIWGVNYNFVPQRRIFCSENHYFVSQCQKFSGLPPCIHIFLKFEAVFLFKVIFFEYFDLWYFILSAPIFLNISKLK